MVEAGEGRGVGCDVTSSLPPPGLAEFRSSVVFVRRAVRCFSSHTEMKFLVFLSLVTTGG